MPAENPDVLTKIEHEHARLRELLATVSQLFKELHSAADRLPDYLQEFAEELEEHFEHEELGGYFSEVAAAHPELNNRIDTLREQHQEFRGEVQELLAMARATADPQSGWRAAEDAYNKFIRQLMRHEANENELVHQAYTQDTGEKD